MANTFTLISSVTVGSGGASTIDFTSIPNTYTDLCLKLSGRTNNAAAYDNFNIRVNNSSAASYSTRLLYGDASTAQSASTSAASTIDYGLLDGANATSSIFASAEIYIPNYAGSTNKSFSIDQVTENNATGAQSAYAAFLAALWANTSAINSIKLYLGGSNVFVQYSTAYLYGVSNA